MRFELAIKNGNRVMGERIIILIPETATPKEIERASRLVKYAENLLTKPKKEKEG